MIDTNEIFKQARVDLKQVAKWIPALTGTECTKGVATVLLGATLTSPDLILTLLTDKTLITILQTLMAYAFEAGRLYGQAELTESIFNLEEKAK